jgi:hypothetical protein
MAGLGAMDYWQVLGLEPGADAARLKRAFREQARRWHPDLNANDPVAEERFKRIKILPISANEGTGIDALRKYLESKISKPEV